MLRCAKENSSRTLSEHPSQIVPQGSNQNPEGNPGKEVQRHPKGALRRRPRKNPQEGNY